MKEGLKELGKFSEDDVVEIMEEADLDKNGVIDETEFARFAQEVFIKKEVAKEGSIDLLFKVTYWPCTHTHTHARVHT